MGGAVTALVNDVGAVYYNPAGVVQADRVNFTIGYFYADPPWRSMTAILMKLRFQALLQG